MHLEPGHAVAAPGGSGASAAAGQTEQACSGDVPSLPHRRRQQLRGGKRGGKRLHCL